MRLSTGLVNYVLVPTLMMIIGNVPTANSTADVHFYQYESSSKTYKVYAYDHNDCACGAQYSSKDLKYGEFVTVYANKDHESTIQTVIEKEVAILDGGPLSSMYYACDDYGTKGKCSFIDLTVSMANVHEHYIFYPSNETICLAQTDSNGDLIYDDNDLPIGICHGCAQIITGNQRRRHLELDDMNGSEPQFLRGGM